MKFNSMPSTLFCIAVSVALLLPVLTEFVLAPSAALGNYGPVPYQIANWTGEDIKFTRRVVQIYGPMDVRLTWRKYSCSGQPSVETIVQQATNYQNLHDVFRCLGLVGADPKRKGILQLGGAAAVPATLFECRLRKQPHYALFCYQTTAGPAIYPANGLLEEFRVAMLGRRPCRLVEVTTPIADDPEAALARLQEIATGLCEQPM